MPPATLLDVAWIIAAQVLPPFSSAALQPPAMAFPEARHFLSISRAFRGDHRLLAPFSVQRFCARGSTAARTLLQHAALKGDAPRISLLLSLASAYASASYSVLELPTCDDSPNILYRRATPLALALCFSHEPAARALLAAGASLLGDTISYFKPVPSEGLIRRLLGLDGGASAAPLGVALRVGLFLGFASIVKEFGALLLADGALLELSLPCLVEALAEDDKCPSPWKPSAERRDAIRAYACFLLSASGGSSGVFDEVLSALSAMQDRETLTSILASAHGRERPEALLWSFAGAGMAEEVAALMASGVSTLAPPARARFLHPALRAMQMGHEALASTILAGEPSPPPDPESSLFAFALLGDSVGAAALLAASHPGADFSRALPHYFPATSALSDACEKADVNLVRALLDGGIRATACVTHDDGCECSMLYFAVGCDYTGFSSDAAQPRDKRIAIIRLLFAAGATRALGCAASRRFMEDCAGDVIDEALGED